MTKEKEKEKEKKIEEKLKECEKLKNEYLDGWKRMRAEFLNYKKEEYERKKEWAKFVKEDLILKILLILDSFDLFEKNLPENLKENPHIKGVFQIKKQILDFLDKEGVKIMKTIGKKFDPNFHEAVKEVEEKGKEPGTIVEEVKKGYFFEEKVLRPAKVKVVK